MLNRKIFCNSGPVCLPKFLLYGSRNPPRCSQVRTTTHGIVSIVASRAPIDKLISRTTTSGHVTNMAAPDCRWREWYDGGRTDVFCKMRLKPLSEATKLSRICLTLWLSSLTVTNIMVRSHTYTLRALRWQREAQLSPRDRATRRVSQNRAKNDTGP